MRSGTLARILNSRFCCDGLGWLSLRHPICGNLSV